MSVDYNDWKNLWTLHVGSRYWNLRWEKQNDTDEEHPDHGNIVDRSSPLAKCEGPLDELDFGLVKLMGQDNRDIGQIKSRRSDIENGRCSLRGSNGDAVEADAKENDKPDRIDRRVGIRVDLGQEVGEWQRVVSSKCVSHPGIGQHC